MDEWMDGMDVRYETEGDERNAMIPMPDMTALLIYCIISSRWCMFGPFLD